MNINFVFTTHTDHEEEGNLLSERHDEALTIAGTQKLHWFEPISKTEVRVKEYTAAASSYVKKVSAVNVLKSLENSLIKNYVTVEYLEEWWLGFVIEKNESTEEATINFLQPKGPARSFTYPDKADILKVPYSDVLSEADVSKRNGRTYNVAKECQERATAILQNRL